LVAAAAEFALEGRMKSVTGRSLRQQCDAADFRGGAGVARGGEEGLGGKGVEFHGGKGKKI